MMLIAFFAIKYNCS